MQYKNKPLPDLSADPGICCGCTACMTVCPVNAITMQTDDNGFLRPVIAEEKCLRCGKCLGACAFKKDSETTDTHLPLHAYAVRSKDTNVVTNSSSGGAFTAISDWILRQQGAIASAVYDYASHTLRYRLYTDESTRNEARGSKYIHPILDDIYDICLQWMKENPEKPLLFVGTGCHVAGFHEVLNSANMRQQAILVDLICHGTPSPKLWTEYVQYLEKTHQGKAEYVSFKDKRNGWENPYAFVRIAGREIPLDSYSYWFYESFSQRESCFHCPYTKLPRTADLTIGDFWGINVALPDFYSSAGNSLVFVQTLNGDDLFDEIKKSIDFEEIPFSVCMQPRLETPGKPNVRQKQFWHDYQKNGVPYLIKHYHEDGKIKVFSKKVIRKGKRLLRKVVDYTKRNML